MELATEEQAKAFAMCMAEAGYPLRGVRPNHTGGFAWDRTSWTNERAYRLAVGRAGILVKAPSMVGWCLAHYMAWWEDLDRIESLLPEACPCNGGSDV